MKYHLTTRGIT